MTRLLCCTLLFLIALPVFAQDEPPTLEQTLPRDPALLMRMRDQLTLDLQRTQQMLGFVNPNDTQLVENLTTQQADLARQINDVMRQLQTLSTPNVGTGLSGLDRRPGMMPQGLHGTQPSQTDMPPGLLPNQTFSSLQMRQEPVMPPVMPHVPGLQNAMPINPPINPMPGGMMMGGMPPGAYHPPMMPTPMEPMDAHWGNQPHAWDASSWGPRLPRELTEVKQSVESLQKEIVELRGTIKALETQIQLLTRNILLSERARENGE